jgi:hypothetical protein
MPANCETLCSVGIADGSLRIHPIFWLSLWILVITISDHLVPLSPHLHLLFVDRDIAANRTCQVIRLTIISCSKVGHFRLVTAISCDLLCWRAFWVSILRCQEFHPPWFRIFVSHSHAISHSHSFSNDMTDTESTCEWGNDSQFCSIFSFQSISIVAGMKCADFTNWEFLNDPTFAVMMAIESESLKVPETCRNPRFARDDPVGMAGWANSKKTLDMVLDEM